MSVFEDLVEAYEAECIHVSSGLNPTLTDDFFAAPFTWFVRDGVSTTDGVGISPIEVYLVECLGRARPAQRVFVIGNAWGWSTLALALANPGSTVVGIDAGFDDNAVEGLDVTNRLAARLGVDVRAIKATSPQDVGGVIGSTLGGVDLVFVDGFHTSEQVLLDWRAVAPFLTPSAVALFHDVVFCDLSAGIERIVAESGWRSTVLHATTTGMALLAEEYDRPLERLAAAFGGRPEAHEVVRRQARDHAHLSGAQQRHEALDYIRQVAAGRDRARHLTSGDDDGTRPPGALMTASRELSPTARCEIAVRTVDGVPLRYRTGTTDEWVLDDSYAAARFLPEGFRPPPDGVVIDAGAHIGAFAALVARYVPHGAVHALEPSGDNIDLLTDNLRSTANAVVHRLALSGSSGRALLHHAPGAIGHSFFANPDWAGEPREPRLPQAPAPVAHEDVDCVTLTDFLGRERITRVSYLKMNIEGAEYAVLLDSPDEMLRVIDCMHVELHPVGDRGPGAVRDRLERLGFTTRWLPATDNPAVSGWLTARQRTATAPST